MCKRRTIGFFFWGPPWGRLLLTDRASRARSRVPSARYVYNVDYGRILDTLSGHDDAVSSIRLRESTLVTASWDSTIKVRTRVPLAWRFHPSAGFSKIMWTCFRFSQVWECPAALGDSRRSNQKYEFGDHESEVKAVDLSADRTKVVSGSKDGNVVVAVEDPSSSFAVVLLTLAGRRLPVVAQAPSCCGPWGQRRRRSRWASTPTRSARSRSPPTGRRSSAREPTATSRCSTSRAPSALPATWACPSGPWHAIGALFGRDPFLHAHSRAHAQTVVQVSPVGRPPSLCRVRDGGAQAARGRVRHGAQVHQRAPRFDERSSSCEAEGGH